MGVIILCQQLYGPTNWQPVWNHHTLMCMSSMHLCLIFVVELIRTHPLNMSVFGVPGIHYQFTSCRLSRCPGNWWLFAQFVECPIQHIDLLLLNPCPRVEWLSKNGFTVRTFSDWFDYWISFDPICHRGTWLWATGGGCVGDVHFTGSVVEPLVACSLWDLLPIPKGPGPMRSPTAEIASYATFWVNSLFFFFFFSRC